MSIENFINVIRKHKEHKEDILNKLKTHVNNNMVYFQNVSSETLETFANLSPSDYLCFDTESCRDFDNNEHERVWCWSLSNTLNDLVIYGYTLDDFMVLMKRLYDYKEFNFRKNSKSKNINVKFFVHNLGWDFEFLKYMLDQNNYVFTSKILFDDNTVAEETVDDNSWSVVENGGQVYNATVCIKMPDLIFGKKSFKSFIKLKFYDSAKLIPDSLNSIGKNIISINEMFNKLGVEFDYTSIRPYNYILTDIEKCYIYNDVYILKEFILQYYIANGLEGYTASGIAFNNMLNYMFPDSKNKYDDFTQKYPEIKDRKIISLIDSSYSGGYTYCNPSVKSKVIEKQGHSIDRNSSYPSAMKYDKLPYGKPKYFKGKYKYDSKYDIAIQKIRFDGFRRKNGSNIGFIKIGSCCDFLEDIKEHGFKKNDYVATNFDENGNLITYNYNLVFTIDELEMLLSVYDFYTYRRVDGEIMEGRKNLIKNIEYVEGVKFLSKIGDFGEFIDDCVLRKNKYKDEDNECGKTVAKRDMNSLYGKLGSGFERTIYNYIKDDYGYFVHQRKYITDSEFDYEEKRKYYRAFASFTTSYGRIALISIIIKIEQMYGEDNFLYSDTDSIYATLSVEQFKAIGVELHGSKLGAWDIEKTFSKFKCLGAKKYILLGHTYGKNQEDKISAHCSGLPYTVQKTLTFENFYLGATYRKKQKRKVIGGYRLEEIDFTLNEFTFYR